MGDIALHTGPPDMLEEITLHSQEAHLSGETPCPDSGSETPGLMGETWATSRRLLGPCLGFGWLLSPFQMPSPLPSCGARGLTPRFLRTQHLCLHSSGHHLRLLAAASFVTDGPCAEAHQKAHVPDTPFALGGSAVSAAVPRMVPPWSRTCSRQANSSSI